MSLKKKFLALSLSFTLLFTSCSKNPLATNVNHSFENFTLNLFRQNVASNTLSLHYSLENPAAYGIENYPITLGSFETNNLETLAYIENCEATLKKFPYKSLSKKNQLTYDILSHYLTSAKESVSYSLYEEPLSPVTGIHAQLPVLLAEYSLHTEADVSTYLTLLQTLPDYFASLISFEQRKSDAGLFMSDSIVNEVVEQCNAFISMGDSNYLLSTFEERLHAIDNLSVSKRNEYVSRNQHLLQNAVIPAYEQLISSLLHLKGSGKNEQGLCYLPNGREYYCSLVKQETCSSRSVEELISLIQNQIATDLIGLQQLLTDNPTLLETSNYPQAFSPSVILEELKNTIASAFPMSENVNITVKYVPTALEPYLSPAFYLIPAIDNTSENTIYINQGHSLDELHLFTTLAHEGYPGHLYQNTYYISTNPDPLRTLFNFKGYVEGWATYAEMCSYYWSSIDKPHATLLQKNNSLILGLYALADIGIHYGGWNLDRTLEFFRTYGIENDAVVQEIYAAILSDPANYLAYYVGYLEILEIKQEYMTQKGDSFSQKEFHKKLLDIGPAPFEIVNKLLNGT